MKIKRGKITNKLGLCKGKWRHSPNANIRHEILRWLLSCFNSEDGKRTFLRNVVEHPACYFLYVSSLLIRQQWGGGGSKFFRNVGKVLQGCPEADSRHSCRHDILTCDILTFSLHSFTPLGQWYQPVNFFFFCNSTMCPVWSIGNSV
jgi:hypothetical protein